MMNRHLLLLLSLLLTACASVVKMEGEQVVNNRMTVQVTEAWNKVVLPGDAQPFEMWTREGIPLDHLRFWAAVPSGAPLIKRANTPTMGGAAPRVPTFTAGMTPDQLVSVFETLYSVDGSLVSVTRVEPAAFAGDRGVRFEFSVVRKSDHVQLQGVGWASVRGGELYAATFVAPRLHFFPRLLPLAESVVKTARVKG